MKKYLLLFAMVLCVNILSAQLVDHKGNRNQTYPKVFDTNPTFVAMINQVDTVNLYNDIYWMQQFIRDCASPAALTVQNFLIDRFEGLGLETYIHHHTGEIGWGDTLDAGNVIAIQRGTEYPDEYIIVASHYDHPDGPGADDNASGTAGVLECARILSQHQFKRSILYIPFNGEERWMVGSYPFVEKCAREDMDILGVFDMDMIGFWPGAEYGPVTMYTGYSYISKRLFEYYQRVANLYIPEMPTCRFTKKDSYGGDHMCFNIHGYPALYIGDIEYHEENVYYHTPNDTIGTGVNCFALAQGFVKAVIAATAELADGWLPPRNFSLTIKNDMPFMSWEETPETDLYMIFKDDLYYASTEENSFFDEMFIDDGSWHRYFVRAVTPEGLPGTESNMDSVYSFAQLQLPAFYDFEDGTADNLHLYNDNWSVEQFKNRKCLITRTYYHDNTLQMIETPWFTIPEDVENASFGFKMVRSITSIWSPFNAGVYIEVTTDRKHWHFIDWIWDQQNQWHDYAFSLNDFIGEEYVQVRIRFEASGQGTPLSSYNYMAVDDFYINFETDAVNESYVAEKFNLSVSPNPANGYVNVSTGLDREYAVYVYNMLGVKMLSDNAFRDGTLDLTSLPAGIYFISVNNGTDMITKRVLLTTE
ncbi:MAG: M28 family peptidase [Bacteroidales bacterium]|nr:M28 family peptidase [Bacteroidales bacterium]